MSSNYLNQYSFIVSRNLGANTDFVESKYDNFDTKSMNLQVRLQNGRHLVSPSMSLAVEMTRCAIIDGIIDRRAHPLL